MLRRLLAIALLATPILRAELQIQVPSTHQAAISQIATSPSGRFVATLSADGNLKYWTAAKRDSLLNATLPLEKDEQLRALYLLDEDSTAVLVTDRRVVRQNLLQSSAPQTLPLADAKRATLSPDRQSLYLAIPTDSGVTIAPINLATFQALAPFDLSFPLVPENPSNRLPLLSLSPDSQSLFVSLRGANPTLIINLADPAQLRTIDKDIEARGFLPDGRLLSLKIGDDESWQVEYRDPETLAISYQTEIAAKGRVQTPQLQFFDESGKPPVLRNDSYLWIATSQGISDPIAKSRTRALNQVAWLPQNDTLVTSGYSWTRRDTTYDLQTINSALSKPAWAPWGPELLQPLRITAGISLREALLETADAVYHLRIVPEGLRIARHSSPGLGSASFGENGNTFYLARSGHGYLDSFDTRVAKPRAKSLSPKTKAILGADRLAVSPDGRYVASSSEAHLVLYDKETNDAVTLFDANVSYSMIDPNEGNRIAFSPDSRHLIISNVTIGADKRPRHALTCYDIAEKRFLWTEHTQATQLAFSPDGADLLTLEGQIYPATGNYASQNDTYVFDFVRRDAATGQIRTATKTYRLGSEALDSTVATYTREGRHFAYISKTFLHIMDTETMTQVAEVWPGDNLATKDIASLTFLGEKRWLLATLRDEPAFLLFDTEKDEQAARFWIFRDGENWAATSYQGYFQGTEDALKYVTYRDGDRTLPLDTRFATNFDARLFGRLMDSGETIPPPPSPDLVAPSVSLALADQQSRGLVVEDDVPTNHTEADSIELAATATASVGEIAEIRLYHNEKLVANRSRGLVVDDDPLLTEKSIRFPVALLPGENRFKAIALSDSGLESKPAELIVERDGTPPATGGIKLHLLVVGIDAYKNPRYNLNYAVADAQAFTSALQTAARSLFSSIQVTSLLNADATRTNIEAAFGKLQLEAGPRDVFIFYYAGHGVVSEDDARNYFLMPAESTRLYGVTEELANLAVSATQLQAWSRDIPAQKQLFLLDACQAAGALESVAIRGAAEEKAIAQLARSTGTHWLAASGSEQFASEVEQLGHGVFTYALIEALKGAADTGDGRVTINELKSYIEAQVPDLTRSHKGSAQYPASFGIGQDFPLGLAH